AGDGAGACGLRPAIRPGHESVNHEGMVVGEQVDVDEGGGPPPWSGRGRDGEGNRRPYRDVRRDHHAIVRAELRERFGDDGRIDASEDPVRWRRAVRCHPVAGPLYRVVTGLLGLALSLVGTPMVPLVRPGCETICVGL